MTEKSGSVPLPTPSDGSLLRVWYNPDESEFQQPQVQQVVAFDALPNDDCVNGSLVDVNQHFVVYAVKNGLIRVLHRMSPLRSLLRGHTRKITDLQFFQNGDVLGSCGGNVIVWRIFERSPEIVSEKLLEIPDTLPSISRLIWHPFNPNQFWLVHHNNRNVNVATLVETTHITTVPHEEEAHALCSLHDDYTVMDGAIQLVNSESNLTDLCWSGRDTRHVLTTHSDGRICLWDCKTMDHSTSSSGLDGSAIVPAKRLFTLEEGEEVTRCLFLPHDNVVHTTGASLTSAFVTGSNDNATITLWSAFTENSLPKKLQVFGMSPSSPTFGSYNLNQVFGPAPPNGSPPSCFLLVSDRQEGRVYCVHVQSQWSDETSPRRALACGLDYVVPLSTKFPIYSWSIMATPAQDDHDHVEEHNASLNFAVMFYAYQSKMVQKYTLPQYMLLPPKTKYDAGTAGVQMEQETVEPTYEEDYDLSDVEDAVPADEYDDLAPDASSLPTPDGLDPEPPKDSTSDGNPFANWLGSLAAKTGMSGTQAPPPTPVTPKTTSVPDDLIKSVAIPDASSDRAVSAPPSKSSSFLSPQELLSESKSDLDMAAGSLPPNPEATSAKPVEAKKAKAPKEQQRKAEAKKAPTPSGPISILKREDKPVPLPSASALPPMNVSEGTSIDSAQLEFVLEKVLSAHFKRQESMLVERVNKMVHTEVQTNVLPALSKTITQTMTAMNRTSKDGEKAQAKAVAKAVTTSVQEPLREAFSQSMKSVLIPAYESATREMFGQIATNLDKGMAAQGASEDVSAKLDSMAFAIESLSSEVSQLRSIISTQGLVAAAGNAKSAEAPPRPTEDVAQKVRNEVLTLLQLGQYEQAFTKAVSASAADMAVLCCKNSDLTDVLGGNSPALSQPILLCLMQQLGAVLVSSSDSDLQVVVAWLQEIALSLDPADDSIERHVPGVLKQLVDSVNDKMAQGDPAMRRPLHMLLQVIRGLQR